MIGTAMRETAARPPFTAPHRSRSLSEYLTGPGFCGSNALKIAEAAFRFDFERLRTVFLPQGVEARDESNVS